MDLALGFDEDAEVEHDHSSEGEDGGCEELYVRIVSHGIFRLTAQK